MRMSDQELERMAQGLRSQAKYSEAHVTGDAAGKIADALDELAHLRNRMRTLRELSEDALGERPYRR